MFRIKIETEPPLPPLKAWHFVAVEPSIAHLKCALCAKVLPAYAPDDIDLSLDGYLLLEHTSLAVLRDDDLVRIQQRTSQAPSSPPSRPSIPVLAGPSKLVRPPPKKMRPMSDSAESSTSDDSDSDSSSSSTSSTSSSTSSSSSASSLVHPPQSHPAKIPIPKQPSQGRPTKHVPPGEGKSATHSRNIRRRKKKYYDRFSESAPAQSSNPNDIPIQLPSEPRRSTNTSTAAASSAEPSPIMMASLSNKNKRRGFKQAMSSARPAKIIFAQEELGEAPETHPLPFIGAADRYPRLIPPSEKQDAGLLPLNVFVTSVDVEEPRIAKRKRNDDDEYDDDGLAHDEATDWSSHPTDVLNQVDTQISQSAVNFLEVQRKWDTLPVINDPLQIGAGTLVTWKALDINPVTCTPEICLFIGRVVDSGSGKVSVERLQDHSAQMVSALTGDLTMGQVEEEYLWSMLLEQGWRLVEL